MKVEDVMRCNFASWYDRFFDLTMESIILPLPDVFVDYLNADSVVLPEGSHQGVYSSNAPGDGQDSDEEKVDWNSGEDCLEAKMPNCDYFLKIVDDAIERLGGRVFPKLNWSAPQDASWVSLNNSLECRQASDICLLLKSSNFISRDLTQPFVHCEDGDDKCNDSLLRPDLVLKRWADINTGHEFRCFVYQGKLVGICPRNHSKYFQHIVEHRRQIQDEVVDLFQEAVDGEFTTTPSASYTFDVWRKERDDLWIIDFNPFGAVTDPLLFDWDEMPLLSQSEGLVFRCVESEAGVQPSQLAQFGVPTDFMDLATGQDPFKLMDLLKLGGKQGQDNSSSSEDDDDDDDDRKEKEAGLDTTDR